LYALNDQNNDLTQFYTFITLIRCNTKDTTDVRSAFYNLVEEELLSRLKVRAWIYGHEQR